MMLIFMFVFGFFIGVASTIVMALCSVQKTDKTREDACDGKREV